MARIHPTAIVDPSAKLAEDVEIGPYCIVEGDVEIGAGTRLRANAIVRRYTTLGENNLVDSFCVLGGEPQDLKFDPSSATYLRIGDGNVFREGVTISRATGEGNATIVGNNTYWMMTSHAGHNAIIGDNAILVNSSAIAGHAVIGKGVILSGGAMVHQFTWVGDGAMFQGNAIATMHVPPYTLVTDISKIAGLNVVGMRRNKEITDSDRRQVKEAFKLLYRSGMTTARALEKMDEFSDWGTPACKFREFVRNVLAAEKPHRRGLCPARWQRQGSDEE